MEFSQIHISKGSGKLELINSISTNTLTNDYCSKQAKNKKSICSLCYSQKSLKTFRKNMVNVLDKNSRLLSEQVIQKSLLPTIFNSYFRFNSHGELINMIHLENLVNIAKKNKHCNFTLWSKRYDLISIFFDSHKKPKNLFLVYSNSKLNKPVYFPIKHFDKTFNNITKDKVDDFKINCFSKCKDCLLCYTKNKTTTIIEKVK